MVTPRSQESERGQLAGNRFALHLNASKLMPPVQPSDVVTREKLVESVAATPNSLISVVAPAGFGKTTFMAQTHEYLVNSGIPVCWMTVDSRDDDFCRFFLHFKEAFRRLGLVPEIPTTVSPKLKNAFSVMRAESYELVDTLGSTCDAFAFFIDDLDKIHSPDALAFLEEFIRVLNKGQRIIIGMRAAQGVPRRAVSLVGDMVRIDAETLSFAPDEIFLFFRHHNIVLSGAEVATLKQKSQGWATVLRLTSLAFPQDGNVKTWIDNFVGSIGDVGGYFSENVFSRLSDEIREFLIRCSIFDELQADACDSILKTSGSLRIISEIYNKNIFITISDRANGGFALHSLFREYLLNELAQTHPELISVLHRRAAEYFAEKCRYADALHHAMRSENLPLAADILDVCAVRLVEVGQVETIAQVIDKLPPALIADRVTIQRARAYSMLAIHRLDDARDALGRVRQLAVRHGKELGVEATVLLILLYEWTDRHDLTATEITRINIDDLPEKHFAIVGYYIIRGQNSILAGDYAKALQYFSLAKSALDTNEMSWWPSTYLACFEGAVEMTMGNTRGAILKFEHTMATVPLALRSVASAYLADALYSIGETDRAGSVAEQYLEYNRSFASPDVLILSYRTAARVNFLNNNLDKAEELLTELGDIGNYRHMPRLKICAWLEKSRMALLLNDVEMARRYALLATDTPFPQNESKFYPQEIDDIYIASARMKLVLDDAGLAAQHLEAAIQEARGSGRRWRRLRLQSLLAQAYARTRRRKEAVELLAETLRTAAKSELISVFSDEPWYLAELLDEVGAHGAPVPRNYFDKVVGAASLVVRQGGQAVPARRPNELLTLKEMAILKLVAQGKLNKQICHYLEISENTVETHLKRINQKLGARNRTQAVAEGRKLGLLG